MVTGDKILKLNSQGNHRGMSQNSLKNLHPRLKGNNHADKDLSITRIQREMMGQLCPYAKDPTWTWAYALAEAGMRDALTEEKARENLKDRLEGKVTLPIGGENGAPIKIEHDIKGKIASLITRLATSEQASAGDTKP